MKNNQGLTPLSSKQVVDLATTLRNKLTQFGVDFKTSDALDGLPVHLADTYEVCIAYASVLNRFLDLSPSQTTDAKDLAEQINYQLYEHLRYHLKQLSPGLRALTEHIDSQKRDHAATPRSSKRRSK